MTEQEIRERIRDLSDEMDANDEENRLNQDEINKLYAQLDNLKHD